MEAVEGVEPLHGRPNGFAAWLERRSEGTSKPLKNIEFLDIANQTLVKPLCFSTFLSEAMLWRGHRMSKASAAGTK